MANPAPVIGSWYRNTGGDIFEVVAIDADDRTIEIQYFDGAVEELDLEDWVEDQIEATEAPEDWTGSVDVEPKITRTKSSTCPPRPSSGPIRSSRGRGEVSVTRDRAAESPDELERY